jgi:hypothetical protein
LFKIAQSIFNKVLIMNRLRFTLLVAVGFLSAPEKSAGITPVITATLKEREDHFGLIFKGPGISVENLPASMLFHE